MTAWRAWLLATAGLVAGCADGPPAGLDEARLHHVHLEAGDPGAEMDALARGHDCQKLILPGTGVGVRCGRTYVLFERRRDDTPRTTHRARIDIIGRGDDATVVVTVAAADALAEGAWIARTYGARVADLVRVEPAGAAGTFTASLLHVGVGWRGAPAEPAAASPGGLAFEHLLDVPPGPDAYWCPMHPDVRSSAAATCPLCGMALVAMPGPAVRDYFLDAAFVPAGARRGRLRLGVLERATRTPVTAFTPVHERLLHLFLISRRLEVFQHLHPELGADGRFTIDIDLPADDAYMIVADVHPSAATPQMLQTLWATPGYRGNPFPVGSALRLDRSPKVAGSVRAALDDGPVTAGRESVLTFRLSDARSGAPVTDLEPYLGAPGHLVIASADLGDIVHSHPADVTGRGPMVGFEAVFPRAGLYKMWLQVQRGGRVETATFVVAVD